jgi:hypothetical protein
MRSQSHHEFVSAAQLRHLVHAREDVKVNERVAGRVGGATHRGDGGGCVRGNVNVATVATTAAATAITVAGAKESDGAVTVVYTCV